MLSTDKKKLEATEMWFLRRMLKIKWTDKISNEAVLSESGVTRRILKTIANRQVSFCGHVVRKEGIENLTLTGKIFGKKSRGKQRRTFLDQLKEWTGLNTEDLLKSMKNRALLKVDV